MNNSIHPSTSYYRNLQPVSGQVYPQYSYNQLFEMGARIARIDPAKLQESAWQQLVNRAAAANSPNASPVGSGQPNGPAQTGPIQQGNLLFHGNAPFFVHGALIIPVEVNAAAGQLFEAHGANIANQEWQQVVAVAAQANGGIGNDQEGYLAWSKEGHFVRMYNPSLSPEHNRRLAEMSLQGGFAVEDLPSRWEDIKPDDQQIHQKLEEFLNNYETSFQKFIEDPAAGLQLKDGRHHYLMQHDPESGYTFSKHYKMPGGVRGWLMKNMKKFGKIADIVSVVANFIPGWGTAVSAIVQMVKNAGGMIAAGKAKAGDIISSIGSAVTSYFGGGTVEKVIK